MLLADINGPQILVWYTQDFSAQYIDEFDNLPYELDSVRHHVERIVFASAPWQAWLMDMRSVYRWEQPAITFKWFALYVALWYTEHLVGFLVRAHSSRRSNAYKHSTLTFSTRSSKVATILLRSNHCGLLCTGRMIVTNLRTDSASY